MARVRVSAALGTGIDLAEHDLDVAEGELFALVNPDARWGRSLLRLIAGLDRAKSDVFFGDTNVGDVAPEARGVSMVFPSGALYAHLSVRDNIAFGLRARRSTSAEIKERIAEATQGLRLEKLLGKSIPSLSPAERVRVALARALVRHPSILLLDEAFAPVGGAERQALRTDFLRLQRKLKLTTLMATSDLGDALALGHRVAYVEKGMLRQLGTPTSLYDRPCDRFVAEHVGTPPMTLLPLDVEGGHVALGGALLEVPPAARVVLGIRPEVLSMEAVAARALALNGTVVVSEIEGARARVELAMGAHYVTMLCDAKRVPAEGAEVTVFADLDGLRLFTADELGVSIPWGFANAHRAATPDAPPQPVKEPPKPDELPPPDPTKQPPPEIKEPPAPEPSSPPPPVKDPPPSTETPPVVEASAGDPPNELPQPDPTPRPSPEIQEPPAPTPEPTPPQPVKAESAFSSSNEPISASAA